MPQIPVLIPIIVTGLLVGSVMINRKITKKRLGVVSLLSGVLNGAQAYLGNLLLPTGRGGGAAFFPGGGGGAGFTPPPGVTFTARNAAAGAGAQTTELAYTLTSIVVGILIPLVILGIGLFRARSKGGEEEVAPEEETDEKTDEAEESTEEN